MINIIIEVVSLWTFTIRKVLFGSQKTRGNSQYIKYFLTLASGNRKRRGNA